MKKLLLLLTLIPSLTLADSACKRSLNSEAASRGVQLGTLLNELTFDSEVISLLTRQPEFSKPFWSYIDSAVTDARIKQGRDWLARYKGLFDKLEKQYGVSRTVIVAIWGMETNFGTGKGTKDVFRSLFTLSCNGHRQAFYRDEFFAAVRIEAAGELGDDEFNGSSFLGSWAGAFGHTQFMPTTFLRAAVDGDGDGKRNVIASIPDALASTANLLKVEGWAKGADWGVEVTLPASFNYMLADGKVTKSFKEWAALGVVRVRGAAFKGNEQATLFLPSGAKGPVFLLNANFKAIMKYNSSESYALAVAHLANRLGGGLPFARDFPRGEPALSHNERVKVQSILISKGYLAGEADGRFGSKTRDGVRAWQKENGVLPDGFMTKGLMGRM